MCYYTLLFCKCKNRTETELVFGHFSSISAKNWSFCKVSFLRQRLAPESLLCYTEHRNQVRRPAYGTFHPAGGPNPQVLAFYGGRDMAYTPEKIQEDFYAPEEGARRCLVEFEGAPVGYIQIYQLDAQLCQEYHYPYQPGELLFGIDQFIGEPALWGKQIGRRFLALVLRRLTQEEGAAAVILDPHAKDPHANNPRALRCYEACGFRKVKFLPQHELHEGVWEDCWLMEYRPGAPR